MSKTLSLLRFIYDTAQIFHLFNCNYNYILHSFIYHIIISGSQTY